MELLPKQRVASYQHVSVPRVARRLYRIDPPALPHHKLQTFRFSLYIVFVSRGTESWDSDRRNLIVYLESCKKQLTEAE